jgi:membrane fusion protein (multidrug efflux system)
MEEITIQKTENKKAGKKIFIFLLLLVAGGIGYTAYWNLYASKQEDTDNAYVSGIQNIITSQVSGNIIEVNIQDSEHVSRGTTAIRIDNEDYKLNLEKASNDLAHAARNFKSLEITNNQNSENVKLKHSDFIKDTKAYQAGVLSREQLDNSQHTLEQTKIALQNSNLNLQNSKIQSVANSIYEHPDIAKAINQYKSAFLEYKRTVIVAPTSGVIAKKAAYLGQRVSPNQQLFTIVDQQNEWIDANFKESQLKHIKIGQSVEMYSDVNDKLYKGIVSGIGAGSGSALSLLPAQNATGNWIKVVQRVPVRIELDKDSLKNNGLLPIGTSMRVKIDLTSSLTTPTQLVQKTDTNYDTDELDKQIKKIIQNNLGVK